MDQLEHAAREGSGWRSPAGAPSTSWSRQRVTSVGQHEALVGWLPMTGEELTFRLDDIESFQVIE